MGWFVQSVASERAISHLADRALVFGVFDVAHTTFLRHLEGFMSRFEANALYFKRIHSSSRRGSRPQSLLSSR